MKKVVLALLSVSCLLLAAEVTSDGAVEATGVADKKEQKQEKANAREAKMEDKNAQREEKLKAREDKRVKKDANRDTKIQNKSNELGEKAGKRAATVRG
jgi:hypothetical protein